MIVSCDCGPDKPEPQPYGTRTVVTANVKVTNKSTDYEPGQVVDGRIYNIGGVIFKKVPPTAYTSKYYFYIELDNKELLKWRVEDIKYDRKNVGDRVHFEYLNTNRFSDGALD